MGFCCEDRAFPWKSFLKNCFVQNSRAGCPSIFLGSICKDIEVIGVVLENIVKFLLISAGMGLSFGMFIQFQKLPFDLSYLGEKWTFFFFSRMHMISTSLNYHKLNKHDCVFIDLFIPPKLGEEKFSCCRIYFLHINIFSFSCRDILTQRFLHIWNMFSLVFGQKWLLHFIHESLLSLVKYFYSE